MEAGKEVQGRFANGAADQALEDRVARADVRVEGCQSGLRLDDEALPATLVEPHGDIVGDGVAAADVDVEAFG